MKAVCWCGTRNIQVANVPEPRVLDPRDVVVRLTVTTICGSDLHLFGGYVSGMKPGDILGHEIAGVIVETGSAVTKHKLGDRVVVSSVIGCGACWYCHTGQHALCDNSNPNAALQEKYHGYSTAGVFGFSHLFGGYAGSQAEYVRVPFADVGAFQVPDGMSDEQALSCSDIFPTGFMAADNCELKGGEVVAVWGCGPVGLMSIQSAYLLGAEHVIAIDNLPDRLRLAADACGATPLNHDQVSIPEALKALTGGRGPDACIDAVGMEAHGMNTLEDLSEKAQVKLMLQNDRLSVVRQMILCCRKGGTISLIGVYAGVADKVPLGVAFVKNLRIHMGDQHGPKYIPRLFDYWRAGRIDPAFVYTHRFPLTQAVEAYDMFREKRHGCIKIVLQP
jgi:threonine dehydrogenase-like Zn-dependent dehydrogenase